PATGRLLDAGLSITHAGGRALCAAGPPHLGLDLVLIEPLGEAFAREAFVPGELAAWRRWLREDRDAAVAMAFAANEAALKWLGCGLRLPLHHLTVTPAASCPVRGGGFRALVRWEERRNESSPAGGTSQGPSNQGPWGRRRDCDGWCFRGDRA